MRESSLIRLTRTALLPALAIGVSMSAVAHTTGAAAADAPAKATAAREHGSKQQAAYRGMRASKVIGMEVRNPKGENLGKISDLVVDLTTGDVRYAVLEFDPGIFKDETLFAVPTSKLRMTGDRDELVYDMDRGRLEKVGVPRAKWVGAWRDANYRASVDRVWGVVQPGTGETAWRVSDMLDKDVIGRYGSDIGEIKDIVVNMAARKVHYVAMEFDPGWLSPEKLYAVPLRAFRRARDDDKLRVDLDKADLKSMKGFSEDRLEKLNDPSWTREVDRYLVAVMPVFVKAPDAAGAASEPGRPQPSGR